MRKPPFKRTALGLGLLGVVGAAGIGLAPAAQAASIAASVTASSGAGGRRRHPTLGLDRPQGEHPARSAACPRRASQCRHQRA